MTRDDANKDAERYRWLREQHWSTDGTLAVVCDPTHSVYPGSDCPSGGRLDEAIDAKMRHNTEPA